MNIYLPDIIGAGYRDFWECRKRYRIVKGGRGSKKSTTAALWYIYNMMKYYHQYNVKPNVLAIRRYQNTHMQSTRAQLVWAINKLGVAHLWNVPRAEHTLTYKPSGQQIFFRGMDDPESISSITVSEGHLCWVWWEEAFQVTNEKDFNKVDLSIRGELPFPLFKQHTLTFNPWSEKIWIKQRFFDVHDEDAFTQTTTYLQNEFLSEDDRHLFEKMKEMNSRRYDIEGMGNWGIAEGLIFTNWKEWDSSDPTLEEVMENPIYRSFNGLDFGYNDPSAFMASKNRRGEYIIYIYDEFYQNTMNNSTIALTIKNKGFGDSTIRADSEDTRTINELKLLGLHGITPAKKGPGSVLGGIQKLQDYKLVIHSRCPNFIVAVNNYAWMVDKKTEKPLNIPNHDYSHLPDALRYGTEPLNKFGIAFA